MKLKCFLFIFILFLVVIMAGQETFAVCEHLVAQGEGKCERHRKTLSEHPFFDDSYYWVVDETKVVKCDICSEEWTIIVECKKGTPPDDSSSSSSGSIPTHTCSFVTTCSKSHCDVKVCSCGAHKNNVTCGGGCNSSGYCSSHCLVSYCTKCGHSCEHNSYGTCNKPHCNKSYCTKCGHSCNGDHNFNAVCSLAHCGKPICSVVGCGIHKDNSCGEGHTYNGSWKTVSGVHTKYCGVSGCSYVVSSHSSVWGEPNSSHTSTCKNCTITNTHSPIWGVYSIDGLLHKRSCTVMVSGTRCSAVDTHTPVLSGFMKVDNGGDESSALHIRRCTVTDCNLICASHEWDENEKWVAIDETKHKRICSNCGLVQISNHKFENWIAISDDIEYHYKVCTHCLDGEGNKYKVKDRHIDKEINNRGNGECDLCNKELWRVIKSDSNPTNEDITVKVEMFSDNQDKIILPVKMIDKDGKEVFVPSGVYTIKENWYEEDDDEKGYKFVFEVPYVDVIVPVDNISKSIDINVFSTPSIATTEDVTLKLVTSTEGVNKSIYVGETEDNLSLYVNPIEKVVSNNGTYTFYAEDSLGNKATFVVEVNNIVSGFGTVTTTYDVFENGYIITDILVNVNSAWIPADSLVSCLNAQGSVKKYKVDDTDDTGIIEVKKMMILDEKGEEVKDEILTTGSYYLRVFIGGAGVFDDVGTYLVEINDVNIEGILYSGKNRIEVVVQALNELT